MPIVPQRIGDPRRKSDDKTFADYQWCKNGGRKEGCFVDIAKKQPKSQEMVEAAGVVPEGRGAKRRWPSA